MTWLDTASPAGKSESEPGVLRGPCPGSSGEPADLRSNHPDSSVIYANIKYGEIGSTFDGGDVVETSSVVSPSTPSTGVSSRPFCCLAASNDDNFCGSCYGGAKAEPSSLCGK